MYEGFNRKKENEYAEQELKDKKRFADDKQREMMEAEKNLTKLTEARSSMTDKDQIADAENEQANLQTMYEILQQAALDASADYTAKVDQKQARDDEQAFNDQLQ